MTNEIAQNTAAEIDLVPFTYELRLRGDPDSVIFEDPRTIQELRTALRSACGKGADKDGMFEYGSGFCTAKDVRLISEVLAGPEEEEADEDPAETDDEDEDEPSDDDDLHASAGGNGTPIGKPRFSGLGLD